jgi:hypothetical protein
MLIIFENVKKFVKRIGDIVIYKWVLDKFKEIGIDKWFVDEIYKEHKRIYLNDDRFTPEEMLIIAYHDCKCFNITNSDMFEVIDDLRECETLNDIMDI